ncbi:MAG: Amuc_1102 family pilus-like protein [Terrimicrobiaceae bacterium]|nr:Amuc_1102 family pilus-like protein [Terrimicrobiaceae bacterium]
MRSSKCLFSLVAAAAIAGVSPLAAQTALNTTVAVSKIEAAFVDSPKIGGYSKKGGGKAGQWLEVEATFERAARPTDPKFLEELTFNYFILLKNEAVTEDRKPTMLTGSVTHVDIPGEKDLKSVVFVAPRTLLRLFDGKLPVNAQQAVVDVGVTVSGKDGLLAIASMKSPIRGDKGWWDNAELYTATPGLILNKTETPFASLEWDYHEPVKAKSGN